MSQKIAIIPARMGSQRLENKNIQRIGNYTLVALAMRCAKDANIFDHIILTTDIPINLINPQEELADVLCMDRPEALSLPTTDTWNVVEQVAREGEVNIEREDWICLIQPTSPFRSPTDIKMLFLLQENAQWCKKFYTIYNKEPNGAAYLTQLGNYGFERRDTYGYIMPPERSINVDVQYDLDHAKALFEYEKAHKGTFDIWHPELL